MSLVFIDQRVPVGEGGDGIHRSESPFVLIAVFIRLFCIVCEIDAPVKTMRTLGRFLVLCLFGAAAMPYVAYPMTTAYVDQTILVGLVNESFTRVSQFLSTQINDDLITRFLELHSDVLDTVPSASEAVGPRSVDQMSALVRILRRAAPENRTETLRGMSMSRGLAFRFFFDLAHVDPTPQALEVRSDIARIERRLTAGSIKLVSSRLSARQRISGFVEDLEGAGTLAYVRALRAYNPEQNASFTTYAVAAIDRAISEEERRLARVIRLPPEREALRREVEATARALHAELGHEPTSEQVAAASGIDIALLSDLRGAAQNTVSLNTAAPDGDENVLSIGLASPDEDSEMALLRNQARILLLSRVEILDPRERAIVTEYFGLGSDEGENRFDFAAFGTRYQIGPDRARQLLWTGVEKLRFLTRDLRPDGDALEPVEQGVWSRPMFRNILRRLAAIGRDLRSSAIRFSEDPLLLDVIEDFFGAPVNAGNFRRLALREYGGRWDLVLADIGVALGRARWERNTLGHIVRDLLRLKQEDPNSVELSRAGLLEDSNGNVRRILDRHFPGKQVTPLALVLRIWERMGGVESAFGRYAESRQVRWGTQRAVMRAFRLIADLKLTVTAMQRNTSDEAAERLVAAFGPGATTAKLLDAIRRHWGSLAQIVRAAKDLELRDYRARGAAERIAWSTELIQISIRALVDQHTGSNPDLSMTRLTQIGTVTAVVNGKPLTCSTAQLYQAVIRSEAFPNWFSAVASVVGPARARLLVPLPQLRWTPRLAYGVFSVFESMGFSIEVRQFGNIPRETRYSVLEAELGRPMIPGMFEVNALRATQSENWPVLVMKYRLFQARQVRSTDCVARAIGDAS